MRRIALFFGLFAAAAVARQPLLVISVDGLDNRYLANCDEMKLKIPNLRRLMAEGQRARGVVGISHTKKADGSREVSRPEGNASR